MNDYQNIEFKSTNRYRDEHGPDTIQINFEVKMKNTYEWGEIEPSDLNFREKIEGKVGEVWYYRRADADERDWVAASPWVYALDVKTIAPPGIVRYEVDRARVDLAKLLVERHPTIDNIEVHKNKFRVALRDGTVIKVKHDDAEKVFAKFLGGGK